MKTNKAFLFWYKEDETAMTEYIYVYAFTIKQARFFFYNEGFARNYDYSKYPIGEYNRTYEEVGTIEYSDWGRRNYDIRQNRT